jgi:hypothetical protein
MPGWWCAGSPSVLDEEAFMVRTSVGTVGYIWRCRTRKQPVEAVRYQYMRGCKRANKKADHRHDRRRLACKLRRSLAVDRRDRSLNDVAMTCLRSTPANQAQVLFPRKLRQPMDLAARRATRIKQLFSQPIFVCPNDRCSGHLPLHRERVAQRRRTTDVDSACAVLLVSDGDHRILPLCCQASA